jgi:divinyl protochlorophyllide a 8-vinyl-reductase
LGAFVATARRAPERARILSPAGPRIGPNAVLQTLVALEELEGPRIADRVRAAAGLPTDWPEGLIPEAWFLETIRATRAQLRAAAVEAILHEAGDRTAAYVAAHRIPRPVRAVLGWLPARLALPLLLKAFAKHAWTFAGRGSFAVEGPYPGVIRLEDCPTCRDPFATDHSGAYYEAAFAGLLRLAAPDVSVREIACLTQGAPACRFRIHLSATAPTPGDSPCASS